MFPLHLRPGSCSVRSLAGSLAGASFRSPDQRLGCLASSQPTKKTGAAKRMASAPANQLMSKYIARRTMISSAKIGMGVRTAAASVVLPNPAIPHARDHLLVPPLQPALKLSD